jgi:hypothetical protein
MDVLMQKIQSSRNMPDAILYGGALQDNTDTYYRPNGLASQSDVPAGPPKIFRDYGATAVIDERPLVSLGLQVPRNPQQIALNEYFGRERIRNFAIAQSRMNISEQMAKQAELMANNVIRDEIDRRAGIRRSVLEATGFTPAQIEQEIASNALGGINQSALDIRDRQVQDAVNLYYNINNIPIPVTTSGGITGAISSTVPSSVVPELPADDAEAAVGSDMAGVGAGDGEGEGESNAAAGAGLFGGGEDDWGTGAFDGEGGAFNTAGRVPEEVRGIAVGDTGPLPNVSEEVRRMSVDDLVDYIINNSLADTGLPQLFDSRTGTPKKRSGIKALGKEALIAIVTDHKSRAYSSRLANKQGIGSGK